MALWAVGTSPTPCQTWEMPTIVLSGQKKETLAYLGRKKILSDWIVLRITRSIGRLATGLQSQEEKYLKPVCMHKQLLFAIVFSVD